MKGPPTRDPNSRFQGGLRHYHRSGTTPQRTWDQWVDGKAKKSWVSRNWWRVVLVIMAVLGLVLVIAGLVIELS